MFGKLIGWLGGIAVSLSGCSWAFGQEAQLWETNSPAALSEILTLETVPSAEQITSDEPLRREFSAQAAARYLDVAALNWQKDYECATCHTNMAYMFARPALATHQKDSGEVRSFFESYFHERWKEGKDLESATDADNAVVVAAALSFNDFLSSGELAEVTRKSLEVMWETQRDDGSWQWPHCGWAPMEIDDHYGVTLAALAVGYAPEHYRETDAARDGLAKIDEYLASHPLPSFHHRLMVAWASIRLPQLMPADQREAALRQLLDRQCDDGGWCTASLFQEWKGFRRKDKLQPSMEDSDAYATGLALVILREAGFTADDAAIREGVVWLESNQRVSGKWFSPSPTKDSQNLFSNFGTAFAVLGLQASNRLPGWPERD